MAIVKSTLNYCYEFDITLTLYPVKQFFNHILYTFLRQHFAVEIIITYFKIQIALQQQL